MARNTSVNAPPLCLDPFVLQGFVNAVTTLDEQGRANGIGYVKFNSTDAAQAAIEVCAMAVALFPPCATMPYAH